MNVINVLDLQVANLIAAGEVVDRPSSAVKELCENSIDSGASVITVEIKRGGSSFIRVTDNGCGMSCEDLPLAIKRHATSKIKTAEDLNSIGTLGFRGEALAAISSVSKLRIMSKTSGSTMGAVLYCEDGEIKELSEAGCADGTTIIAEELFANIPARRKFLKRDMTEAISVGAVVEKTALSHPEIAFRFISDGILKFNTAGDGKLYNVIYTLLGREFASRMMETEFTTGGIHVSGYAGTPDNIRTNRNFQNFFINSRYVKCRTAAAAIEQAFDSYIPREKFPCCVINIDIMPAFVDVNVHPAKLEVKFSDDRMVFDALYCAVRNALTAKIDRPTLTIEPTVKTADDMRTVNAFVPIYDRISDDSGSDTKPIENLSDTLQTLDDSVGQNQSANATVKIANQSEVKPSSAKSADNTLIDDEMPDIKLAETIPKLNFMPNPAEIMSADDIASPLILKSAAVEKNVQQPENTSVQNQPDFGKTSPPYYKIIGEAFNSYVFVEISDKILCIDKHAAHERIIFEQMKLNMQKGGMASQILLLPITLTLSSAEYSAAGEYRDEITSCGFSFVPDDKSKTVSIIEYPSELDQNLVADMFCELAAKLADGTSSAAVSREIVYEKALYQASCKAAIKAGRIYTPEHIKWICDRLLSLPDIKFCPHGRPVAFEMTRHDFEKQFKRV